MPSLSDLQRSFVAATVFGDRSAVARLGIAADGLDAGTRIAIYRNNVFSNYRKALAATFPVVQALVGRAFFGAAVEAFVRAHPSTRGDVNRYGGDLPRFLAGYLPARDLPYLADVARLEWAIDQAGIAADADPLDLDALAAVPQGKLPELRFRLHPSVRLLRSAYPILSIWQANQPGHEDERVDLGAGGGALLIARGAAGVGVQRLTPATHAFLRTLAADLVLEQALERALAADAAFDLREALGSHVAAGTIVGFRAPSTRFRSQ
jgi:hypothetical protein